MISSVWCKSMSLTKDERVALFIVFLNNLFSFCRDQAIVYQRINSFGISMYICTLAVLFFALCMQVVQQSQYITSIPIRFSLTRRPFGNPILFDMFEMWHRWYLPIQQFMLHLCESTYLNHILTSFSATVLFFSSIQMTNRRPLCLNLHWRCSV